MPLLYRGIAAAKNSSVQRGSNSKNGSHAVFHCPTARMWHRRPELLLWSLAVPAARLPLSLLRGDWVRQGCTNGSPSVIRLLENEEDFLAGLACLDAAARMWRRVPSRVEVRASGVQPNADQLDELAGQNAVGPRVRGHLLRMAVRRLHSMLRSWDSAASQGPGFWAGLRFCLDKTRWGRRSLFCSVILVSRTLFSLRAFSFSRRLRGSSVNDLDRVGGHPESEVPAKHPVVTSNFIQCPRQVTTVPSSFLVPSDEPAWGQCRPWRDGSIHVEQGHVPPADLDARAFPGGN